MFERPISIAFAPNVEKDDLILSLQLLLGKKAGNEIADPVGKLENEFKKYHDTKYAVAFSSGRAALYYALKSLRLAEGDEVLTQALTCVAVPNSIIWARLKPVYVDIDTATFNLDPQDLEKKITKKTKVVIIQHTFGIPGPIKEVLEIAKKYNLIVVEDCAHALGAVYNGRKVGSWGDVAIFSFGRDKMISSVFGGMIITNNIKIYQNLLDFSGSFIKPPMAFIRQQLLYPILYTISLPFYPLSIGKIFMRIASGLGYLSKANEKKEKTGEKPSFLDYRFSPVLALLVLNQFKKFDRSLDHRKQVVALYESFLNQNQLSNSKYQGRVLALLRYPLLVKSKQILLNSAKRPGIYLGDWYDSPIHIGKPVENADLGRFFYILGSCPRAEVVSKSIINLPTHINQTLEQTKRLCGFLLENRDLIF